MLKNEELMTNIILDTSGIWAPVAAAMSSSELPSWSSSSLNVLRRAVGEDQTTPAYWVDEKVVGRSYEDGPYVQRPSIRPNRRPSQKGVAMFDSPIIDGPDGWEIWGLGWKPADGGTSYAPVLRYNLKVWAGPELCVKGDDWVDIASLGLDRQGADFVRMVSALHEYMADISLTKTTTSTRPPALAKRKTGKRKLSPTSFIVNLRGTAVRNLPVAPRIKAEPTGRRIGVRYEVREHTRNQAYGPGRSLRRLITVPAHVRGPEEAPFSHKNYRVTGEAA